MSSHRDRHMSRIAPSTSTSAGVPQAPPPPVLSSRSRGSRRSRSRSRSPPSRSSRYVHDSRDRDRGRRQSPSPYTSGTDTYRKAEQLPTLTSHNNAHHPSAHQQQSISLIAGEAAPPIIRRILNADEVKIPRRVGEGARPVFEREELKEGMLRRMRSDNNDENPPPASPPVIQQAPQQQRVIAIIREPADLADSYRMPISMKDSISSSYSSSRHTHLQAISPESLRPSTAGSSGFRRSSLSPVPSREQRAGRSALDRLIDRKRDLLYEHREREQELQQLRERAREQEARERSREDRGDRERYSNSSSRPRSRSPLKILRDRRSRSRSRSVTPPPMPPEIRRQLIERDLRNKLSRPLGKSLPNKFESEHDFRAGGSSRGGRGFGRGISRGRGFPRGLRVRVHEDGHGRSKGFWEHDMFEKDINLDQSAGDSKPNKD